MDMKRIVIIGCGGAGKSTLSVALGNILSLPIYHLDRIFWKPGWNRSDREAFVTEQEKIFDTSAWIIDGNYGSTMDMRLKAADTIVFLDLPTLLCLWGALKRYIRFRNRSRPDITEGCPERLTREYLWWIWSYRRTYRPLILEKLEEFKETKSVIVLMSRRAVRDFLDRVMDLSSEEI